jgi:hypothetical protein
LLHVKQSPPDYVRSCPMVRYYGCDDYARWDLRWIPHPLGKQLIWFDLDSLHTFDCFACNDIILIKYW